MQLKIVQNKIKIKFKISNASALLTGSWMDGCIGDTLTFALSLQAKSVSYP